MTHACSDESAGRTSTISLVIPVHNGSESLRSNVVTARDFLLRRCPSFEIIVVDDGSTDGTGDSVRPLLDERIRLIELPANKGKFGALSAGVIESKGSCVVFTDADLPYDLDAIPYIEELVNRQRFHVVVGDRTLSESHSLAETRVARKISSRLFSFFVRMLVTGGLFDSQCGIKGFRSDVARILFGLLTDSGFSGDVEVLYVALKYNLKIRRIPVRLVSNPSSRVRLRAHSLPMLFHILRLRHNWTRGRYKSSELEELAAQAYWPSVGDGTRS